MPLQEKSINQPSREKIGVDPRSMADTSSNPSLQPQPELFRFPGIAADAIGARLQSSMIWAGPETDGEPVAVTFRKTFLLEKAPNLAALSIFADARYILWVNGRYVDRGPGRFQPNGPEYDVLEIAPHLREGTNALAVLVVGNLSSGKIMRHAPGLTAMLSCDADGVLKTDASWKCTRKNPAGGQSHIFTYAALFRKLYIQPNPLGQETAHSRLNLGSARRSNPTHFFDSR
jgi:hypothetical protein